MGDVGDVGERGDAFGDALGDALGEALGDPLGEALGDAVGGGSRAGADEDDLTLVDFGLDGRRLCSRRAVVMGSNVTSTLPPTRAMLMFDFFQLFLLTRSSDD